MKKILASLALFSSLVVTANADLLRVEAGAGVWMQKPSGDVNYKNGSTSSTYKSNETESTTPYAWIYVKHFVPLVPNLRLEFAQVKDDGKAQAATLGVTTGSRNGEFKADQFDIIPYYNFLDNTFWLTLDLGVDIKVFETTLDVPDDNYTKSVMVPIPMGYARARAEIPGTSVGVEAIYKVLPSVSVSGYDVAATDAKIKVDYTFEFTPVIEPAIEIGYRIQQYDIKGDDLDIDMKFAGLYAGVMLRF